MLAFQTTGLSFLFPKVPLIRIDLEQGQQISSVKGQTVNILDFAGHMISVATTLLCCCNKKAAIDNTLNKWAWLYFNKALLWALKFEFQIIFMLTETIMKGFR